MKFPVNLIVEVPDGQLKGWYDTESDAEIKLAVSAVAALSLRESLVRRDMPDASVAVATEKLHDAVP